MKKLQIKFQYKNQLEIFSKSTIRTDETVAEAKQFIQKIIDSGFEGIWIDHSNITYIPSRILKKCVMTIIYYET